MKKQAMTLGLSALLLSGCVTSYHGGGGAIVGASIGGQVGNAVGGLIGGSSGRWHGAFLGSAIGTIAGTAAGAAIGHALTTPKENKDDERQYTPEVRRVYPSDRSESDRQQDNVGLKVRNIRFIDDNRNHAINAAESCKVIFDIVNESSRTAYRVVPIVETVGKAKHIGISSPVMIEQIQPKEGFRYTATIYGGNKLKNGEVTFRVGVADEAGYLSDRQEFTLPTQR